MANSVPEGLWECFEIIYQEKCIWLVSNLKGAAAGNCAENTLQIGFWMRAFLSHGVWNPNTLL